MTKLSEIKLQIRGRLDDLIRQEILADYQVDDLKTGLHERNFGKFPVAILSTPTIENEAITNVQNFRTYTFPIDVLLNAQDVSDPTVVEDLIENIMNAFDNDPTLKVGGAIGIADGGVEPSSSPTTVVVAGSKSYILFTILLRCRAVRDLTIE